jgi:uncharacterized protein YjiS (DUF1127 family)
MSRSSVFETRRARSGAGAGRQILSSWLRSIELWLIRQQRRQDLSTLDDRLLDDIGISREDALWKAGKSFWRH